MTRAVALSERLLDIGDPDQPDDYLLTSLARGAELLMDGRPEEGVALSAPCGRGNRRARTAVEQPAELAVGSYDRVLVGRHRVDGVLRRCCGSLGARARGRHHARIRSTSARAGAADPGEWRAARSSLAESLDSARISGQLNQQVETLGTLAWLDAAQGHAEECRRKVEEARTLADSVNLRWRNDLLRALVLLELGSGLVEPSPLERLRRALGDPPLLRDTPAAATAPEFVEALVRAGDIDAAVQLLAPFADEAERIGQAFPQAVAFRCRALLAAEDAYEQSSSARSSFTPSTRMFSPLRARGWHTASGCGVAAGGSTHASS